MTVTRAIVLAAVALLAALVGETAAQPLGSETVDAHFREVTDLRSRGEFDAAIEVLSGMIESPAIPEAVRRRAYNQLVWTMVAKSDDLGERARLASDTGERRALEREIDAMPSRIGEVVGEALTRFPDIRAGDDVPDPSRVNQMYEPARQRMFGNLVVDTRPDSALVWINDDAGSWTQLGFTPLRRNLYPVGSYEIRISRKGHNQIEVTSRVGPNETTRHEVALTPTRGRAWWLTRVGVPAAGAIGLATYLLLSGDDGGPDEPEPLPLPPSPPGE